MLHCGVPEKIQCALAAVRRSRGLTQRQLGELVGLTQPHLCLLEHGVAPKGLVSAHAIAAALRCDVTELWPGLPTTSPQHRPVRAAVAGATRRRRSLKSSEKSKR